jgi:lysine 2,3-aminomutase
MYCRFCTRKRKVGGESMVINRETLEEGLRYIRNHPEIRDVILSGGDPLLLADERLEWILKELRAIPSVEIIRIGTRVPVVLPQRITPALESGLFWRCLAGWGWERGFRSWLRSTCAPRPERN